MIVTIFPNGYDLLDAHYITIEQALNRIKTGKSKEKVEEIRALTESGKDAAKLKLSLPSVLFHGKFDKEIEKTYQSGKKKGEKYLSKREDGSISEHSGILTLDFDKCDLEVKCRQLKADPYIFAYWISPSGNGVKALIRCIADTSRHHDLYNSVLERYPDADPTSRSISRLCFESYDPDIYVNRNSSVWNKLITKDKHEALKAEKKQRRDYRIYSTAVSMVRSSYDGVKDDTLLKASKLLGGYIDSGKVTWDEAKAVLLPEIAAKGAKDMAHAERTIENGLKYGMAQPLHETKKIEKALTYSIREDGTYDWLADKSEMDFYEDSFLNGTLEMGLTTGFAQLDEHWLLKKNTLVWFAGLDNVGKSFVAWYLSVIACSLHGWKIVIHSAENGDGQVRKKIKEMFLGKTLNEATQQEIESATEFFDSNYRIMTSKKMHSVEDLLLKAEILYDEGFEFDLLIVDPFNALDIPSTVDGHRHNIKACNEIRVFKENYSAVWVVDHVGTAAARNRGEDRKVMTPRKSDVDGGQIKANKTDDFVILHRDTQGEDWMYIQINVDKIKDTETGGKPTQRSSPIMMKMKPNKSGYEVGFDDPIRDYWLRKNNKPIPVQDEPVKNWYEPDREFIFDNSSDEAPF